MGGGGRRRMALLPQTRDKVLILFVLVRVYACPNTPSVLILLVLVCLYAYTNYVYTDHVILTTYLLSSGTMPHRRQSQPESVPDFQVKLLETLRLVPLRY